MARAGRGGAFPWKRPAAGGSRRLALAGALLLALAAAPPARAADPRDLLANSLEPRVAGYYGVQVSELLLPGQSRKRITRQEVFRRGNTLRINYVGGRVVFDNGKEQILYLPRQQTAEKRPSQLSPARIAAQRRALRSGRVTVVQLPDGEVAGLPAYVLSVRTERGVSRTVWIEKERFVQLRQDEKHPNGRSLSTYFTRITFGEPPAAMLTFTIPPETRIVDRLQGRPLAPARAAQRARAWGGLLQPRWLPPGYTLRGHYPHSFQGRPGLVSVYDGPGERTFSIFQGPALGMGRMRARRRDRLQILSAPKGNAVVTIVGPEEETLKPVLDSMEPAGS